MSIANKLLQAAAGNAGGDPVYVEDVFSTYLYEGTGLNHAINNGINLGSLNVNSYAYSDDGTAATVVLNHLAEGDVVVVFNTGSATGATVTVGGGSTTVLEQDFSWPSHNYYQSTFRYTVASGDPETMDAVITNDTYGGLVLVIKGGVTVTLQAGASENSANTIVEPDFSTTGYGLILTSDRDAGATSLTTTDADLTNLIIDDSPSFFVNSCWEMDSGNGGTISGFNDGSNFAQVHVVLKVEGAGTTAFGNTEADGGMVWIKSRSSTQSHEIADTERGRTKFVRANSNNVERTSTSHDITSFNASGFSVSRAVTSGVGSSGTEYCSWTFRKAEKFFDIVTYTGNGTAGNTISHNLGSVPGMIWVKNLSTSNRSWQVFHRSLGNTLHLELDNTNDIPGSSSVWNSTSPTATEFTVGSAGVVNANGDNYVAYLFAHDEQVFGEDSDESIIYCGTYEGDGGTQEITLGWEPQWILSKNADDTSNNWMLLDIMRGAPVEGDTAILEANNTAAEAVGGNATKWYPTATGFKVKQGGNGANDPNENGETYVYAAIRRPNKPASEFSARALFDVQNEKGGEPSVPTGFVTDFAFAKSTANTGTPRAYARITGNSQLFTNSSSSANTSSSVVWDYQDGWEWIGSSSTARYLWSWRRAKGFMDVVAYTATGSVQTISHNLGVTPELMIVKDMDSSINWGAWHKDLPDPDDEALLLNSSNAKFSSTIFNKALPTSTTFQVNYTSGKYVGYLFASVDGIAKVGSYTGTGSDITVDCGFSAGARFILLKRVDSTGDWYIYDSDRGIVAGNDPFLLLNQSDGEVTNTDYIDPDNSGFIVTSSATAALNNSGGTYIFYAIA